MSIDPRSLKAPDPEQFNQYEKPKPLVPAGRYTLKAPEVVQIEADAEGYPKVILDKSQIQFIDGGFKDTVWFTRISSRPREKGKLAGTSRLTDYLLATGTPPVMSSDPEDWARAIEGTAGQFFDAFVEWRAYDTETQETLADKMEDFPLDAEGNYQSWIKNPTTGKNVPAQYSIRYFIRQRGR